MPNKHESCLELLRSGDADGLSHAEVAARLGCNEGTVRRARQILEAERLRDRMVDDGQDGSSSEADRLLREIVAADRAEEMALVALADARAEVTDLKKRCKEFAEARRDAGRAAREFHPLFDRPRDTIREDGEAESSSPRLAAMA